MHSPRKRRRVRKIRNEQCGQAPLQHHSPFSLILASGMVLISTKKRGPPGRRESEVLERKLGSERIRATGQLNQSTRGRYAR